MDDEEEDFEEEEEEALGPPPSKFVFINHVDSYTGSNVAKVRCFCFCQYTASPITGDLSHFCAVV